MTIRFTAKAEKAAGSKGKPSSSFDRLRMRMNVKVQT